MNKDILIAEAARNKPQLEDKEEVINKRDGAKGATTNKRKALEIQKSTKSKKFSKQKRLKK